MAAADAGKSRFQCFAAFAADSTAAAAKVIDEFSRLKGFFKCSNESLVLALVYIDRTVALEPALLASLAQTRWLVVSSVMLAIKFLDDNYYNNAHYARISGLSLKELNTLEEWFLRLMDYRLFVQEDEYNLYRDLLTVVACEP